MGGPINFHTFIFVCLFFSAGGTQIIFLGKPQFLNNIWGKKTNLSFFLQLCDHTPILEILCLTRALYNTGKCFFLGGGGGGAKTALVKTHFKNFL